MPRSGSRVVAKGLTKRFGAVTAVDDLSFDVEPGRVTGFLGPNGAGKTTTLRMALGLVRPTSGAVTVGGRPYARLDEPLRTVGAALDGTSFDPGRTARDHLRWLVAAGGLNRGRVAETLDLTGLTPYARRKVGAFSMGMRQRLALAGAMLGDPEVLVLDEPANGLDPEGIAWLRTFLRKLAAEGRTVLVSSHVLSEVEQTVDEVVVMSSGRLVYVGDLQGLAGEPGVLVDSPDRSALGTALQGAGLSVRSVRRGLLVEGVDAAAVGAAAATAGVPLSHLAPAGDRLEDAFLRMTSGSTSTAEARR